MPGLSTTDVRRSISRLPRERLEMLAFSVNALNKRKNDPLAKYREKYYWKPVDWIDTFVEVSLPKYLRAAFGDIQDGARKIALQGPHGIGKTVFASLLILWVGSVSSDCKIPTTASSWRQLSKFLWPEVHKWYNRVNWKAIGAAPELLTLEGHFPGDSVAFAVACTNSATIEGAHARRVCYVYDEAKAIPPATFDASEGAFSTIGDHIQAALSTPGDASGVFYNICSRKRGYQSWHVHYVSPRTAIRSGRMSMEWARDCRAKWGAKNPVYMNRVWGLFSEDAEDTIIPLRWILLATERWHAWQEAGEHCEGKHVLGADVARGGADRVVFAHRYSNVLSHFDCYAKTQTGDTMVTTGRVLNAIGEDGIARIDVIGVGAGVVDRAREQKPGQIVAINASESTKVSDRSGELFFANVRAAMWWNMRELLDPANNENTILPDDPELIGDLTTPKFRLTSGGKILVESKDEIRKRLGRSTDKGDAACQAFFDAVENFDYVYVG